MKANIRDAAGRARQGRVPDSLKFRCVKPELLDDLPHDAPAAWRARRDLLIINQLLGSPKWFERQLKSRLRAGERILEMGSGDGALGYALSKAGLGGVDGVDYAGRPNDWPERARWFQTSILEFSNWAEYPVVIGNLIFHHFKDEELAALGAHLNRHARLILASEPLRAARVARLFSVLCPLIGADPITRHDGRVSVRAGFRGDELPRLLRLDKKLWSWRVDETWLGASRLIAERRP